MYSRRKPVMVPPPSDCTVAFPVFTMQILACNDGVAREKMRKNADGCRALSISNMVGVDARL